MDKIIAEFDRVVGQLKATAPGLFGIHAAFDKVLADLRAHDATPAVVAAEPAPAPVTVTTPAPVPAPAGNVAPKLAAVIRPEVLAGTGVGAEPTAEPVAGGVVGGNGA